jgi:hypothetical protein
MDSLVVDFMALGLAHHAVGHWFVEMLGKLFGDLVQYLGLPSMS